MSAIGRTPPSAGWVTAAMALAQVIGWGSTYYMPAVLGAPMAADLGMSQDAVYAGVTLMLLVSAALAPRVGARIDRGGGRRLMTAGSFVCAAGLGALAFASGPIGYFASWATLGIAAGLMLGAPAVTSVRQAAGAAARRHITAMLLATGLASSVFWPLTEKLALLVGWRDVCLVFAALHLLVCAPLHYATLGERRAASGGAAAAAHLEGVASPETRRAIFPLVAIAFACAGSATWGVSASLVTLLRDLGAGAESAVRIAALSGVFAVSARIVEFGFGARATPFVSALVAATILPLSFALALSGIGGAFLPVVFTALFSLSSGLTSLARAVLPLHIFGAVAFGSISGRLGAVFNVAFAVSPVGFSAAHTRFGATATLALCLALSLVALFGLVAIRRRVEADAARAL